MIRLADAGQNSALLEICTSQLRSKPEWLTPRLFCAIGYARIGDQAQAKEMLDIYDARKGPAYTGDDFCRGLSDLAHSPPK
jgi:hypothetical protein